MGGIRTVAIKAGIVKDATEIMAMPRWTDADRIRFVRGMPEMLGGWAQRDGIQFDGKCRGLLPYLDNSGVGRLAIGTNQRLYALEVETYTNITPIRASGTLGTDPITTTAGSYDVNIEHTSHGVLVGDWVNFSGATATGGVTIDGDYQVTALVDADNYTIQHSAIATSTATGGGASVAYSYEIHVGREHSVRGAGWGVGTYGSGTYGTARSTYVILQPRVWTLDQWGPYLVACHIDGSIYEWQNNSSNRAAIVSNAPTQNVGMFVTEEKHMVALGAGGDPMKVEWSDQDANTVWTPSDTNTAGGRTLTGGNEILFGMRSTGTNLIFTDSSVWAMTFIGGGDVFGFRQVAAGASGIIGQRAACEINGVAWWMGQNDFYYFDGVVRRIPNSTDIRRFVFDNLSMTERGKVYCSVNTLYNEIWWLYPTTLECDRYVKFNYEERAWDIGTLDRTAMIDAGIFDNPIMAGTDSYLYDHETGANAAGAAMNEYITSAPFGLADGGNRSVEILGIVPDFQNLDGTIAVSVLVRDDPQDTETEIQMGDVSATTTRADADRADGRIARIKYTGAETRTERWRAGAFILDLDSGGRR